MQHKTITQKHIFLLISVFQGTQSVICVLLVSTVMVCLAVTSTEGRDPGRVLCTLIELPLEHAARVTACRAPPVHTVTPQVRRTASHSDH